MTFYYPVTTGSWMKRSEENIYHSFNGYARELYVRKDDMSQEIIDWGDALIRQIQGHVQEQIRLLDREYQNQERYLKDTHKQFIETAFIYEQRQDNEQIHQLLKQCAALKFGLAVFEFPERAFPFIQVIPEKQASEKKQTQTDPQRTDDNISRTNSGGNRDYENTNTTNKSGSSSSVVTSSTAKQTNQQPSTTGQASTVYNNSNRTNKDDGDSLKKCPTCYMIFPPHMSLRDRDVHVNEHFKDA